MIKFTLSPSAFIWGKTAGEQKAINHHIFGDIIAGSQFRTFLKASEQKETIGRLKLKLDFSRSPLPNRRQRKGKTKLCERVSVVFVCFLRSFKGGHAIWVFVYEFEVIVHAITSQKHTSMNSTPQFHPEIIQ